MVGLAFKEWKGTARRTKLLLLLALVLLLFSVVVLTYGNYLGSNV